MASRLLSAVTRMEHEEKGIELRPLQHDVYQSAALYIREVATCAPKEGELPFARIVLPPRIGKTVIAGRIIERSGLVTVYITTTLDLVRQAYREFFTKLPGVPVAMLTGVTKDPLPDHGIVVTTYNMLQALAKQKCFPEVIRRAGLIFADEAHHAMTALRSGILREVFDSLAIRIALTATPDYDEERVLAKFFPDLIHEMTITEGVASGLLAKVHAFTVGVDVGAADVRVVAGNYESEDLGLVMSRLPLLQATLIIRYDDRFRHLPTLIPCASRAQARCVHEYLMRNRPKGTPEPALMLGEMNKEERYNALDAFEAGKTDTLIVVKLLVEGWNSPKCKCLIDLVLSTSWVSSAQKFTRVMTKDGDAEAWIVILQPMNLPRVPVLPVDVFGPGVMESLEDAPRKPHTPKAQNGKHGSSAWVRLREAGILVRSVRTDVMFSEECRIDQIQLPRNPQRQLRQLVDAAGLYPLALDYVAYSRFLAARFIINGVGVKGSQLLRVLGFEGRLAGYQAFAAKYFPDDIAEKILHGVNVSFYATRFKRLVPVLKPHLWGECSEEDSQPLKPEPIFTIPIAEMEESFLERLQREMSSASDKRSVMERYGEIEPGIYSVGDGPLSPEDALIQKLMELEVSKLMDTLSPMEARILHWRFGLDGEEECTLSEIGDKYNLGRERIRQLQEQALWKLRNQVTSDGLDFIRNVRSSVPESVK